MHKTILALVLSIGFAACAAPRAADVTSPEAIAVMAPVHQFVDGFNAGDIDKALAACADRVSILDEFAPFVWTGSAASATWVKDYDADAKKKGITDAVVTLHSPRHVDVTGSFAYVVAPVDYAFKVHGKPVEEFDCTLTIALEKADAGWRITAWTWSKS